MMLVVPAPTLLEAAQNGHLGGETPMERAARQSRERAAAALAEFVEDVEWMAEAGETTEECAERLGVKVPSLNKRLYNNGRSDLWDRLRRNEVVRFGETLGERKQRESDQSTKRWGMAS